MAAKIAQEQAAEAAAAAAQRMKSKLGKAAVTRFFSTFQHWPGNFGMKQSESMASLRTKVTGCLVLRCGECTWNCWPCSIECMSNAPCLDTHGWLNMAP